MLAVNWPQGLPPWTMAVLVVLLATAALVDLKVGSIPNWLTYPAILIALGVHTATGGFGMSGGKLGLAGSLLGMAIGFAPLGLCWLAGGIGGGDAKLMAAIGALGGPTLAIGSLFYACVVAAVMALIVMVQKRIMKQTIKRVWHTLALLMAPRQLKPADPTTAESPKIPFAVALCLGAAIAVLDILLKLNIGQVRGL